MAAETRSWLINVCVVVEQTDPPEDTDDLDPRMAYDLQEAVTAAIAQRFADAPDISVEWESMQTLPLDGLPGVGRCAECNCWVFDVENCTEYKPPLNPGAIFDGRLLCDDHLPEDHPVAF